MDDHAIAFAQVTVDQCSGFLSQKGGRLFEMHFGSFYIKVGENVLIGRVYERHFDAFHLRSEGRRRWKLGGHIQYLPRVQLTHLKD